VALFAVAVLTILTLRALENGATKERREREAELLFAGLAYRDAIGQYYEQSPGTVKHYPATLQALLLDERSSRTRRPLRRLYRDPVTLDTAWGIVKAPDGGVMGVYSLSGRAPVKSDAFPTGLEDFAGAASYRNWEFIYRPH